MQMQDFYYFLIGEKQKGKNFQQYQKSLNSNNKPLTESTQAESKKNPSQKRQFRTKIQPKSFNSNHNHNTNLKITQNTDRSLFNKGFKSKNQSLIVQKFTKSNIFKNNLSKQGNKIANENSKYQSISKRPAKRINTPLKKFVNSKQLKNNHNPQQQNILLNTRKSKAQIQTKKQKKQVKNIMKNQQEKSKIAQDTFKNKQIEIKKESQIQNKAQSENQNLTQQLNEEIIFSRTFQHNQNYRQATRERQRHLNESRPIQTIQSLNGRVFHFPLGPTRVFQRSQQSQRLNRIERRVQQIQQQEDRILSLQQVSQIDRVVSLQEVRQSQIQRLVQISQQNSETQQQINIQELIRNTTDIINFVSRLNVRNDAGFNMMIAQLTQLNTIAQQVNELGQLGNRLGYSLISVFGVRIRQLQTSIVNQVGLALIRNFQQRIDPEFQNLILRQPALKIGFTKSEISSHFQQKINMIQSQCSICLQEVGKGTLTIQLQCRHQFHSKCISHWLQSSKKCPLCRHEQILFKN